MWRTGLTRHEKRKHSGCQVDELTQLNSSEFRRCSWFLGNWHIKKSILMNIIAHMRWAGSKYAERERLSRSAWIIKSMYPCLENTMHLHMHRSCSVQHKGMTWFLNIFKTPKVPETTFFFLKCGTFLQIVGRLKKGKMNYSLCVQVLHGSDWWTPGLSPWQQERSTISDGQCLIGAVGHIVLGSDFSPNYPLQLVDDMHLWFTDLQSNNVLFVCLLFISLRFSSEISATVHLFFIWVQQVNLIVRE